MFNGSIPSLKNLSMKVLAVDIQKGEHDSVSVPLVVCDNYKGSEILNDREPSGCAFASVKTCKA